MTEPNRRHLQVANAIREELVTIARKDISDPRLEKVGMVTFSAIDLTPDLRNATVWVAFMGKAKNDPEVKDALDALNSASKFIHRLLIKRIPIKVHPQLLFKFDRGFDRAVEVNKALQEAAEVERDTAKVRAEQAPQAAADDGNKKEEE
jgi:ribosome-binding factor A